VTETSTLTRDQTQTGRGDVAHIVKDPQRVAEAYLNRTPLEALCGYVWVPSRSPKDLPICQMCKEMADAFMDEGGADDVRGLS
jgi:hypothetical protein